MNWVDVKTKMPNGGVAVLGWDKVRNGPRVLIYYKGVWITESRIEISVDSDFITHWASIPSPLFQESKI